MRKQDFSFSQLLFCISPQNSRYRNFENPNYVVNSRSELNQKVIVWCEIFFNRVDYPYFINLNNNLFSEQYGCPAHTQPWSDRF